VRSPLDPGYYCSDELRTFGFKAVGENVRISRDCTVIGAANISFADNARIDSGTAIIATTGQVRFLGRNHIGGQCHFCAAADLTFGEFSGTSQGVRIYTASDDYSGKRMMGPMVPADLRGSRTRPINIEKHVAIGAGSVVLPGYHIGEGTTVGALSLVNHPLKPWGIYHGDPAKLVKARSRDVLDLEVMLKARIATLCVR